MRPINIVHESLWENFHIFSFLFNCFLKSLILFNIAVYLFQCFKMMRDRKLQRQTLRGSPVQTSLCRPRLVFLFLFGRLFSTRKLHHLNIHSGKTVQTTTGSHRLYGKPECVCFKKTTMGCWENCIKRDVAKFYTGTDWHILSQMDRKNYG